MKHLLSLKYLLISPKLLLNSLRRTGRRNRLIALGVVAIFLVGMVFARLGYKIASSMSKNLGKQLAHTVGLIAQWSIVIFVGFLVLHQLGVAQELLRILFGGIVAMLTIAGGLAFGLGGKETAKEILESIAKKFRQ